jgi:hypothetical protein
MSKDQKALQIFLAKAMIQYHYDPEEKYWEDYQNHQERFSGDEN